MYIMLKGKNIRPLIGVLLIIIIWYVISRIQVFRPYVLPSPGKVGETIGTMIVSGELFEDMFISFKRVLQGFSIAFAFAFSLGMLKVFWPQITGYYEFTLEFFRNVPPLSMIPLLILWCGIGEATKIIIIVLAAFFPMYLSIVKGFLGCDSKLLEVGAVFGYKKFEKFTKIILPSAFPDILTGMRIGMGYSWRAIIGAEMVAASSGLGHMILFAQQMSRTDKVLAGIAAIGIIGILTDWIFGIVIRRMVKGVRGHGRNRT